MASFSYSIVVIENPISDGGNFENAGGGWQGNYYAAQDPGKATQLKTSSFSLFNTALYKDQTYGQDQWVESKIGAIETGNGNWLGLMIRGTLTDGGAASTISGYAVRLYSGDSELIRIDSGVTTILTSETLTTFAIDDTIRLAVRPDGTIEFYHNWTSWSDTPVLTSTVTTSGSELTGDHMGMYGGYNSNQSWWDILQGADDVPAASGGDPFILFNRRRDNLILF